MQLTELVRTYKHYSTLTLIVQISSTTIHHNHNKNNVLNFALLQSHTPSLHPKQSLLPHLTINWLHLKTGHKRTHA